jgi:hypothetical protein
MMPRAFPVALLLCAATARAHGLDANRVEVVRHGRFVEAVATPPAEFLRDADRDGDGRLDVPEVQARQREVLRALRAALEITDEDGRAPEVEREDVSVPIGDGPGPKDFLRYTVKLRWPQAPRALRVRCGFVGEHPVTVFATRAEALPGAGSLTLVGVGEYASLARPQDVATLLRDTPADGGAAPAAPTTSPSDATRTWTTAGLLVVLLGALALTRRR